MLENLIRIAGIIALKLRRKDISPEIEEESKRTQRNSQYQVTSSLLIYHLIYRITHDSYPSCNLSNKTQLKYNEAMSKNFDKYSKVLIELVFDDFAKQLRVIYGERINKQTKDHSTDKPNSNKTTTTTTTTTITNTNSNTNNSCNIFNDDDQDDDDELLVGCYSDSKLKLPAINKESSVLYDSNGTSINKKLFLSLLMELPPLKLLNFIIEKIDSKRYPERAVMEVLREFARKMAKVAIAPYQKANWLYCIDHKLKNEMYKDVTKMLLNQSTDVVFRRFRIDAITDSRDDCAPLEFKQFKPLARFVHSIYAYSTTDPIQLSMEHFVSEDGVIYDYFKFTREGANEIFDIRAINKEQLDGISWKERIDKLPNHHVPQNLSKITPYKLDKHQLDGSMTFDSDNTYTYLKTAGFGIGTFFIVVGNRVEKKNKMHMLTKRHKKMNPNQLYDGDVVTKKSKLESPQMEFVLNPTSKIAIQSTLHGNLTFANTLYAANITEFETNSEV